MGMSSIAYSVAAGVAMLFSAATPSQPPVTDTAFTSDNSAIYAAVKKPACKTGVSKAAKSPISLVPGSALKCYNINKSVAGRKLLTSDKKNTCFACHSKFGISPAARMNSNLRDQGYDLTKAKILEAFNAHIAEMPGSSLTLKQADQLSHYLQSLKTLP